MAKLETKTPIDLLHYEPPGLIGATKRQLICLGTAGGGGAALYFSLLLIFHVPSNFSGYVFVPVTIACIAFGWISPYGLKMEQYLSILLQFYKTTPHRSAVNERVMYHAIPLRKGEYEYPDGYRPCSRRKQRQQRRAILLEARACLKDVRAENRAWQKRCKAEQKASRRKRKETVRQ